MSEQVGFNVPPDTQQVISGEDFYIVHSPTNSTEALANWICIQAYVRHTEPLQFEQ